MGRIFLSHALGLVGAAIGGVVGFYVYFWILRQGFDALVLPGALIGFGCGLLARHASTPRGLACGLAALLLGFLCDRQSLVNPDPSVATYLAQTARLRPIVPIMIAVGALVAYWTGKGATFDWPARAGIEAARARAED